MMLGCVVHGRETSLNELAWDLLMEKIAHRIDKNDTGRLPLQREIDNIILESYKKSIAVTRLSHRSKAFGHSFCIAVLAPWTDFVATRNGIPSRLSPLNGRILSHSVTSTGVYRHHQVKPTMAIDL